MSQDSKDTGFWSGFTVGDAFEGLVGGYVARETARAEAGAAGVAAEQNALINRPDHVTQRPNAQPNTGSGSQTVTAGSGQGAERSVRIGGMKVNRTALYIAGAALAAAVVMKVAQ